MRFAVPNRLIADAPATAVPGGVNRAAGHHLQALSATTGDLP